MGNHDRILERGSIKPKAVATEPMIASRREDGCFRTMPTFSFQDDCVCLSMHQYESHTEGRLDFNLGCILRASIVRVQFEGISILNIVIGTLMAIRILHARVKLVQFTYSHRKSGLTSVHGVWIHNRASMAINHAIAG